MALPADNEHRASEQLRFFLALLLLVNYGKITVLQNIVV